jgi:hypothetical protein
VSGLAASQSRGQNLSLLVGPQPAGPNGRTAREGAWIHGRKAARGPARGAGRLDCKKPVISSLYLSDIRNQASVPAKAKHSALVLTRTEYGPGAYAFRCHRL